MDDDDDEDLFIFTLQCYNTDNREIRKTTYNSSILLNREREKDSNSIDRNTNTQTLTQAKKTIAHSATHAHPISSFKQIVCLVNDVIEKVAFLVVVYLFFCGS